MNVKIKYIIGIIFISIVLIIGFLAYGLHLMDQEDRYGDLVYVSEKVEDGDVILKCNDEILADRETQYQEIGMIEKSWGKTYVYDNKNTVRKALYDWAERGNAQKVKVIRPKGEIDFGKILKVNGNYNYLLESKDFILIAESL